MKQERDEQFVAKRQSLVSIAMLKVNYDERQQDYVDYLAPFVFRALRAMKGDGITGGVVSQKVRETSSLVIPVNTIELFLNRLVKRGILRREYGNFWIAKDLPADEIISRLAPIGYRIRVGWKTCESTTRFNETAGRASE
jgi:hypothetical protein